MEKRLYRNENDKVIAGVSSGIATYMEVDVTIIRLLFVLSSIFLMGTGILVYLVMWIVVPVNYNPTARFDKYNDFFKTQQPGGAGFQEPTAFGSEENVTSSTAPNWSSSTFSEGDFKTANPADYKFIKKNNDTGRTIGGLILLVIGLYFLMYEFNIIPHWFSLWRLWPLIFVAIGISLIAKSKRQNAWEDWKKQQEDVAAAPTDAEKPDESTTTPL
ncbi:PspC domain-containing protein [Pedobacter sp.]|uniref:PspC domain-containing protein n=1 Tax=Pedobacter sp. TaxID=1411316 RepID=UPI003D7F77BC